MADERKLRLEALAAVDKANWKRAHECYAELEQIEPADGLWPQKVGEICRKLGRDKDAVAAYSRAVDRYADKGALLKAIAVCKLVLQIDTGHSATLAKLALMHGSKEDLPMPPRAGAKGAGATGQVSTVRSARGNPATATSPGGIPAIRSAAPSLADMISAVATASPTISATTPPSDEVPFEFDAIVTVAGPTPTPHVPTPEQALAQRAFPKTPIFSTLTEPLLRTMIERVTLVSLETDQVLFYQGAPADALYVIASGEISVRAPREVARLAEGAFLGEIALLVDQPRGATAVATQPSEVLAIDRETVTDLIGESPGLLKVFLRFLRDRLTSTAVETSPLFACLSATQRPDVAAGFQFGSAQKGSRLLEQGQASPGLFILLAGTARVAHDGQKVADLAPGDAFGEISLLSGKPATASVEVTGRSFLLFMPRAVFVAAATAHPAMQGYLTTLAQDRLRVLKMLMI